VCVHVRVLVAMMRVCVCVRLCARVGDSVRMRACVVVMVMVCVYAHQHRTYTLGGGYTRHNKKERRRNAHSSSTSMHAPGGVRVRIGYMWRWGRVFLARFLIRGCGGIGYCVCV